MIGLDTNVVVRMLVDDDPAQAQAVRDLLAALTPQDPAYIGTLVLAETFWVLTRSRDVQKDAVIDAFARLVQSPEIVVDDGVVGALEAAARGADLPDALIDATARARGCRAVVSFDRRAAGRLGWTPPDSASR